MLDQGHLGVGQDGLFFQDLAIYAYLIRPVHGTAIAVAPYNLQVRKLRDRLPAGARVGSVDKFQGQEAPVVIISMCSSAGDFGTRGLQFLLNKNRLNVAVSRAKSLTIVVGDPGIAHTSVNSVKDMALVNMFCRLVEHGRRIASK